MSRKVKKVLLLFFVATFVMLSFAGCDTSLDTTNETFYTIPHYTKATKYKNEIDELEETIHKHDWTDATCTAPKTCSTCGETKGNALGHSISSGKCLRCGNVDSNYVTETKVWIPTNGGKKYHRSSGCSNMKDPIQVTKSEAINRGFDACKRCY